MATTTANYGLRKPAPADTVNVELDIGANMDTIDEELAAKAAAGHTHVGLGDDLTAHAADTTSVHGIANTAALATTTDVTDAVAGKIPATNDFTTTDVTGFGTVAVFDSATDNGSAVGLMQDADTKPRVLLRSDGQVLLGNGTANPNIAGMYLDGDRLTVYSDNGVLLDGGDVEVNSGDILCSGGGPVLYSPNNTAYRISVNNDGSLSTTVV